MNFVNFGDFSICCVFAVFYCGILIILGSLGSFGILIYCCSDIVFLLELVRSL